MNDELQHKKGMTLSLATHESLEAEDIRFWRAQTPETRLEMVERLRLKAGKFLYDYPARFQRVIEVVRR